MKHSKQYIIDTNVLLDDPSAPMKLRNGNQSNIYIPYHVLLELNKFKKDPRLGHIVARVSEPGHGTDGQPRYPGGFHHHR